MNQNFQKRNLQNEKNEIGPRGISRNGGICSS